MARQMGLNDANVYRTVVGVITSDGDVSYHVYGPYDNKSANKNYLKSWGSPNKFRVSKQELRPVFTLNRNNNLVLGLDWVTYERDGVKVHGH